MQSIINANNALSYSRHCQAANTASLEGETLESFDRSLPALLGDSRQTNRHLQHHRRFTLLDKLPDNGSRPIYAPKALPVALVAPYQPTESEQEAAFWLLDHMAIKPFNVRKNRLARLAREKALAAARKGIAWAA